MIDSNEQFKRTLNEQLVLNLKEELIKHLKNELQWREYVMNEIKSFNKEVFIIKITYSIVTCLLIIACAIWSLS